MKLLAGPWRGEFGWELCWWNPAIRQLSRGFDSITIVAPSSTRYLYEFADDFIPIDVLRDVYWKGDMLTEWPRSDADVFVDPEKVWDDRDDMEREWRRLGTRGDRVTDVMMAIRPPKPWNGTLLHDKSYPISKANEVVSRLRNAGLSVANFGGSDNLDLECELDLRGAPLDQQCNALASAMCSVGPSSGTMHLASLCGCPHVTWYTRTNSSQRYMFDWNPFHTPVDYTYGVLEPRKIADKVIKFCFSLGDNKR